MQKCFRDGIRITQRRNAFGSDRTFGSPFINHHTNDFDVIRCVELLQYFLAIGHLRNGFARYKACGIDVFESRRDQSAKVTHLELCWDLPRETLPRITWTLDQFDSIVKHRSAI